jgi:RNA recognition motif-containing protein
MKIFIGNLNRAASAQNLKHLFEPYGEVSSHGIIIDRYTARSRGIGHVEMPDNAAAERAMEALNHAGFMRQSLNVRPMRSDEETTFGLKSKPAGKTTSL